MQLGLLTGSGTNLLMEWQMHIVPAAVAAGAVLAAACTSSHVTASDDIAADDLVVTASVTATTFRAGEVVIVTVTATNPGNRPQTIGTNLCPDPFVVTTQAGKVVGPGSRVCSAEATSKQLAPGEQFVLALPWAGDAQRATPDAPGVLSPDTYLLRGRVASDKGYAWSQPVTIRITK